MFLTARKSKIIKVMKKIFIYMAVVMMMMGLGASLTACSGYENDVVTAKIDPIPEPTPQDTTKQDTAKWDVVIGNDLIVNPDNMMATAYLKFVKNGIKDSIRTESWLLDIKAKDMTVYRDSYQPTIKSGKNPDAQRSTDQEFKDKYGNMQTRNYYTQDFEFNNFTHSISGAWNTAYVLVKGKPEYFWPYDGLYYEINKLEGVGDTTHVVRNDSIFAVENLKIEYKATLRVDKQIYSRYVYYREATIKVISFIGLVEKEEEIPTANFYVSNLKGHVASGNRFFKKIGEDKDGDIGYWEDGFLMSSDTHYILLIVHYTVDPKDGKSDERFAGKEIIFVPKSEMITPAKGREYNAVMYDWQRKKYIPCCLSNDYSFNYGSRYANGTDVTFKADVNGSIMAGIKNFAKDKDASPSPWLETSCAEAQYNGKNYYTITLKSSVHTNSTTVADEMLKK